MYAEVEDPNIEEAMYLQRIIATETLLGIGLSPKAKEKLKRPPQRENIGVILTKSSNKNGLDGKYFHEEIYGIGGENVTLTYHQDEDDKSGYILSFIYNGKKTREEIDKIRRRILSDRPDLRRFFLHHPLEDRLGSVVIDDESWEGKGIRDNGLTVRYNNLSQFNQEKRWKQFEAAILSGAYFYACMKGKRLDEIADETTIDDIVSEMMKENEKFPVIDMVPDEDGDGKLGYVVRCNDYESFDMGGNGKVGGHYKINTSGRTMVLNFRVDSFGQRYHAEKALNIFNILINQADSMSPWESVQQRINTEAASSKIKPEKSNNNVEQMDSDSFHNRKY